jgi:hypothetical protein
MSLNLLKSTQFFLDELVIVTKGGKIDIKNVYEEINIFDTMFLSVMSGNIIINDAIGLSSKLLFDGSESLLITVKKDKNSDILTFKSNMDSGMFLPMQIAAAKALGLGKEWYDSVNAIYSARREKVFALLDTLQCTYSKEQVGMFVWAKIPSNVKDGYELSDRILYNHHVFITPGGIFGSAGNGYIRVSLCGSIEKFEEAIARVKMV